MSQESERTGYRLFKPTYRNRQGEKKRVRVWYCEFRDQRQKVQRFSAFESKPASHELGRNLVKLVEYHVATNGQTDPSLSKWLAGLSTKTRQKLAKTGLIDPERLGAQKSLAAHLEEWAAAMRAEHRTEAHVVLMTGREGSSTLADSFTTPTSTAVGLSSA
jgi:hypothetical protein